MDDKTMQRYFVQNSQIQNQNIMIMGNDYHHIRNVMRMKTATKVYVCDEDGNTYLAAIEKFTESAVILGIIAKIDINPELKCRVTIAMGLTKQDKQEEVLRRITELGAAGFIPVAMERSVVQVKDPQAKLPRLEMIVKEAAEQSHRSSCFRSLRLYLFQSFSPFPNVLISGFSHTKKRGGCAIPIFPKC
jgi:16S rRNA (uracil1498-N3)-methyltransferase